MENGRSHFGKRERRIGKAPGTQDRRRDLRAIQSLVLPNDSLSIYVKQGTLDAFLDRFRYYAEYLGPVTILNLDDEPVESADAGIRIFTVRKSRIKAFEMLQKLYWLVRLGLSERPDFFRTTEGGTFAKSALIGIAGNLTGIPAVSSLHGHYDGFGKLRGHKAWQFPLFFVLERITGWTNALVVSNSEYTRKQYFRDTEVVPNYIDCDAFKPAAKAKKWDAVYVGSLIPIKGIDTLVEAFARVRQRIPHATLLVGGHGPHGKFLKNRAGVQYDGAIANRDLPDKYARSRLFVTATQQESFGIPMIEAQACGIPIVASDLPPFHENTLPGASADLVPASDAQALADAIVQLLKDTKRRAAMGKTGRRFAVQKFGRNVVLGREIRIIRRMLGV